jgi:HAMP domain-containing protein
MSEGNRFVVEVVGKLREAREVTVSRVCEALGLDEARAGALVARMPGVITKPVGEDRAMKIALRLQEAGVPALHRPLADHEDPFKTNERPGGRASSVAGAADAATAGGAAGAGGLVGDAPVAATAGAAADPTAEAPGEGSSGPVIEAPVLPAWDSAAPVSPTWGSAAHVSPQDVPSVDATHHDLEPDPKLTPMTAAGFGAADIVLPTNGERAMQERPRPRATFVEAGPTSMPSPPEDPAVTMVRPPTAAPTPTPPSAHPTPVPDRPARAVVATPVPPSRSTPLPPGRSTPVPPGRATPVPPARRSESAAGAGGATAPVYRQTRSSAEPPLTLAAPPDEVLQQNGVPDAELSSAGQRRRGRFGRHLAAQVALPGLLTWSLTAVALWWFLGDARNELFVLLAGATAVAALIGSLVAALGTAGIARDVVRLRDEARRVAMGELTTPVASNRDDELGELAGSLERMRLSLQEGLERLRQRKR